MARRILMLVVVGVLARRGGFTGNALPAEPEPSSPDESLTVPVILSDDFRVSVQTNRNVYYNKDVLRLTVKLLNNSPYPAFIGVCPIEPTPQEPTEEPTVEIDEGVLDDVDVDVAIMPPQPIIIGYATLKRLGPSPMPERLAEAEEAPAIKLIPKKFRLPLFGSPRVPAHSTRIISTANILIAGPLLEVVPEPVEPEPGEEPSTEAVNEELDDTKDVIPAVGKLVLLRPGYYLLDCRINRICGTKLAQAQKIVQIKRRMPKSLPTPAAEPQPRPEPTLRPTLKGDS